MRKRPQGSQSDLLRARERHTTLCDGFWAILRLGAIHPSLVVRELLGDVCDRRGVISAIDLDLAETSDRFYGPISTGEFKGKIWNTTKTADGLRFSYTYLGRAPSGTEVRMTQEGGGGSGVFTNVLLLATESRVVHEWNSGELEPKLHQVLRFVGSVPLGDRFSGEVRLYGMSLRVDRSR